MESLSMFDQTNVKALLEQKNEEQSFASWVDKKNPPGETGKEERRILIITKQRIFSMKDDGKIAREAHYLDLVELGGMDGEVTLTFKTFKFFCVTPLADEIIHCIRTAFINAFPAAPEKILFKCTVKPESRLKEIPPPELELGGFVPTYRSYCDYYGVEPRDDVLADARDRFLPLNVKEFNLKEFDQMSSKDFTPLILSLKFNTHFTRLVCKDYPLDSGAIKNIAEVLKSNFTLEEVTLQKVGLDKEGLALCSQALAFNKSIQLTKINLSKNKVEDRGCTAFASYVATMSSGIVWLDLSNCSIGKSGISSLADAFKKNAKVANSLAFLNLSGNKLDSDGSTKLSAFLASPNSLESLIISDAHANLGSILPGIIRGSMSTLKSIDASGNKISKKESSSIEQYLKATTALLNISLSGCSLPPDCLKSILANVKANLYLNDLTLNISDNKLGVAGAKILAETLKTLSNAKSIDISGNDFGDEGLAMIAQALRNTTHIKHVSMGRNFSAKAKGRDSTIRMLCELVSPGAGASADKPCSLESITLTGDSKTEPKGDLAPFIIALGANSTIKSLDVSGNNMGRPGAYAISKMLMTNKTLETLRFDHNNTPALGFDVLANALKKNNSLKRMPMPNHDIRHAHADKHESFERALDSIQKSLLTNCNPTIKFDDDEEEASTKSAHAKDFAFLSSASRAEMNQILYKIKSVNYPLTSEQQVIVDDAENQDNIMVQLFGFHDVVHHQMEAQLKDELVKAIDGISPLFAAVKNDLIQMLAEQVRKSSHSLDEDTIKLLPRLLQVTGQDLTDNQGELIKIAGRQLQAQAGSALFSTITIASDFIFEKMASELQLIFNDIQAARKAEMAKKEEEEEAALAAKKSPTLRPGKKDDKADKKQTVKKDKEKKKLSESTEAATPASPPPEEAKKEDEKPEKAEEKADKPDKPDKPEKPTKPEKPKKPEKPEDKKSDSGSVLPPPKEGPEVDLSAAVEKKQIISSHMTKGRPQMKGKRPPTRKRAQVQAPKEM